MVLACTVNGMPLVYSGQEAGLDRSLKFFDKDLIDWKDHKFTKMYTTLFTLKHHNEALWNGNSGGEMIRIFNDKQDQVISFAREKNGDKIITIINYSGKPASVKLNSQYQAGSYKELFTGADYVLKGNDELKLDQWQYLVLVRNN
jgi:maltooligosyltrehalose synthase